VSSRTRRAPASRGIFHLTRHALHAVTAACWLGVVTALLLLPTVLAKPHWLLDRLDPAIVAAHGDGPHLLLHFCGGLLVIAVLLALSLVFLGYLQRFVRSISDRQPFTQGNVRRLRRMAWLMLAMETLSILIGVYASWMGPPFAWMEIGGGMSITGLVAVLMLFVTAHAFSVGATMREDLDGVV